jgi:hypothetical protein
VQQCEGFRRRIAAAVGTQDERRYRAHFFLPAGGIKASDAIVSFHAEHGIMIRQDRGSFDDQQFYVRYCFADSAIADAFRDQFGGERLPTTKGR